MRFACSADDPGNPQSAGNSPNSRDQAGCLEPGGSSPRLEDWLCPSLRPGLSPTRDPSPAQARSGRVSVTVLFLPHNPEPAHEAAGPIERAGGYLPHNLAGPIEVVDILLPFCAQVDMLATVWLSRAQIRRFQSESRPFVFSRGGFGGMGGINLKIASCHPSLLILFFLYIYKGDRGIHTRSIYWWCI